MVVIRDLYQLNDQAKMMSDVVIALPLFQIVQGVLFSDVCVDTICSDYRFHQKTEVAQADLQRASMALQHYQKSIQQCRAE